MAAVGGFAAADLSKPAGIDRPAAGVAEIGGLVNSAGRANKESTSPVLVVNGTNDIIVATINSYILQQFLPDAPANHLPRLRPRRHSQYPRSSAFERNDMTFLDEYNPKQLTLTAESPTFWRVTFDNPPVNVIGPDMISDLKGLLTELEHNDRVNVVLFDSADPDFYLAHYDLAADPAIAEALPSPTGYPAWTDITVRLSKLSAVRSARSAASPEVREASSHWLRISDSPAARRRFWASSRSGLAPWPGAAQAADSRHWSDADARSKSSWAARTSTAR
jgi:hypothetical protein